MKQDPQIAANTTQKPTKLPTNVAELRLQFHREGYAIFPAHRPL